MLVEADNQPELTVCTIEYGRKLKELSDWAKSELAETRPWLTIMQRAWQLINKLSQVTKKSLKVLGQGTETCQVLDLKD